MIPASNVRHLALHPGPKGEYSVVRWTAPEAGTVEISTRFTGLAERATTDVHVLHNGRALFDGLVNVGAGGNSADQAQKLAVQRGWEHAGLDPATASYGAPTATTVYSGAALVRPQRNTVTDAGEISIALSSYDVKLPVDTPVAVGDTITVSGTLCTNAGAGVLVVTNTGAALQVSDSFQIFNQPLLNGQALTVLGGGKVDRFELFVDGRRNRTAKPGERLALDTNKLGDGRHELRVVAIEAGPIQSQGRRIIPVNVENQTRKKQM